MPIQDSDLLLIEDTRGDSFKITASKLKSNLPINGLNNYKLLVNKPDFSSAFVYAQNMQHSVAPNDYMMVERSGVSYKVTGQQVIDYFPSVPTGAAGPITNVYGPDAFELATSTNVSDFNAGDAIHMVDISGATTSYTPQTNAITAITTENSYYPSINHSNTFTETPINFVNGSGGSHQTTKQSGSKMFAYWDIPGVGVLGPQNSCSFYVSNGSSASYKNATIQITANGNEQNVQSFTIGPGGIVSFPTIGTTPQKFFIEVKDPLNEYILISDFKIGGQTVNIPTPVPTLTFSPNNIDLQYFKEQETIDNGSTILDVDTANNKMQIKSNTYSIGDTVTGPTKSGTGNFREVNDYNGVPDVLVSVDNSNGQWIGENRLGADFYMTTNSARKINVPTTTY